MAALGQHDYLLTSIVGLPAVAAFVVALLPGARARLVHWVGVAAAVAGLGLAIAIGVLFRPGVAGYQMVADYSWIGTFGISFHLGVDGISLFLVLLTAALFPVALIWSGVRENTKGFVGWMLLLESACMASFLSLDLFLFFVAFETTLVPMYFIIGGWGFERRGYAAIKFFLYTFLGSALFFVGMLAVVFLHQQHTGQLTFNLVALSRTPGVLGGAGTWLFLAFTAAFAVKAPVFPFHTWAPDAYRESPTAGVIVLAAVMAKLGTYGIIRFDFNLFPRASVDLVPLMLTLAVIGILYGAVVACRQRDLKCLIAYSSLSHMGFIVLGLFALDAQGTSGSVIQMLNHGLYTAALFLLIGWMYRRWGTWRITELRGVQRVTPLLAGAFTVAMMASIGLPGLNGFVGEFLILLGTFVSHRWWAVAATVGVIAAALYLLWAYQQVFHGRPRGVTAQPAGAAVGPPGERGRVRDLSGRERLIMIPLLLVIVFLGVYPQPVLARITPSVQALVAHVEHADPAYVAPRVSSGRAPASAVAGGGGR
ncbi:MAG TPA: NADH-quinone oxidoreductase subunit M [Acidimicrobiales bacterium]|nr:NADH-quinone oxidoreductase subunit M [Acidimicrobiales bacterium]